MTRSNPATSVDAAEKALTSAETTRQRVHAIVAIHGPLTLDQLVAHYRRYRALYDWRPVSDQGVRSRCSELVRGGLVEAVPGAPGYSSWGNRAKLWRAVSV